MTYETKCSACGLPKANYLFTPSMLKAGTTPYCRKCVSGKNRRGYQRPGAPVGYGWRGPFLPEREVKR
jgi:hypothetical protein